MKLNTGGISDDQILRIAFRKIFQEDFSSIKEELSKLREELQKIRHTEKSNELLTMDDLCKELKLSRPSIYKLIKKGKIRPIQLLEQDFRFRRSDVDMLIENSYHDAGAN